ncbi:MAG TPA: thiamine phosphate synthase [Polyangiaceae bacterium]|nr:thiamine phosphate synthase [Polyangiaceae bacterium]
MTAPRLIVISDSERGAREQWLQNLQGALSAARPGSVLVLLRDPASPIRARLELGRHLRGLTRAAEQLLSVSDRLDLAWLLEADGVHLSEASVSTEDARLFAREHGRRWWVSRACHEPRRLLDTRADALLLSPIAEPRKGRPALGLDGVREALELRARRPPELGGCELYALGGITRHNAAEMIAAGAQGVALIGELFLPGAAPALLAALGISQREPG